MFRNHFREGTFYKDEIELKKIHKHPNYIYPNLYDDIAVVELGRRIEFDFEKVRSGMIKY